MEILQFEGWRVCRVLSRERGRCEYGPYSCQRARRDGGLLRRYALDRVHGRRERQYSYRGNSSRLRRGPGGTDGNRRGEVAWGRADYRSRGGPAQAGPFGYLRGGWERWFFSRRPWSGPPATRPGTGLGDSTRGAGGP